MNLEIYYIISKYKIVKIRNQLLNYKCSSIINK